MSHAAPLSTITASISLHLKALRAHSGDEALDTGVPEDVCMAFSHGRSKLDATRRNAVNEWIRGLIVYLEDTTIRAYAVEDRNLLKSTDEAVWFDAVCRYVRDLQCPVAEVTKSTGKGDGLVVQPGTLLWVLGHAISLAYDDGEQAYGDVMTQDVLHSGVRLEVDVEDYVMRSEDIIDGAATASFGKVCESLAVHQSANEITTDDVERCIYRIESEMMPFITNKKAGLSLDDEEAIKEAIPLGFSTGDDALDRVARVLRILHIKELRRLQNTVDDAIAAHQNVTANPRTETGPKRRRRKETA